MAARIGQGLGDGGIWHAAPRHEHPHAPRGEERPERADAGGFVALWRACSALKQAGDIKDWPITDHVAAISCGVYAGQPVLDLDYAEDSVAGADGNFVMTGAGGLVEVQASAEGEVFDRKQFDELMRLAEKGIGELIEKQKAAIGAAT